MRWVAILGIALGCALPAEDVGERAEALRNLDATESEFLDLLNDYRASNGLDVVFDERACNQAARDYSQLMGERNHFDHTGPDGSSPWDRMCDAGYTQACGPSTAVAENIAAGNGSAFDTFEQWRTSPGHDRNMRGANFRVVGIGRAEVPGSRYRFYWTNVFGGAITPETNMGGDPPPDPDTGPPPTPDAGSDAGGPADAGTPPPVVDAGAGIDSGGPVDVGMPGDDGGSPPRADSGSPGASGDTYLVGGCSTANGSGTWLPLALLLVGLRRRRCGSSSLSS